MQYKKPKGFPEIELQSQLGLYLKSLSSSLLEGSLSSRKTLPSLESLQADLEEMQKAYISYSPEGTDSLRSSMMDMLRTFRKSVSLMKEYVAGGDRALLREASRMAEEGSEMLISLQLVTKESQEMIKDV
jgi:ElaB/YqjD/DUF883 family membrane-anchored ribosome-binding protein